MVCGIKDLSSKLCKQTLTWRKRAKEKKFPDNIEIDIFKEQERFWAGLSFKEIPVRGILELILLIGASKAKRSALSLKVSFQKCTWNEDKICNFEKQ